MDFPPVPLWLVKSPPWHINWGMIRWKLLPLNPKPFSCVHKQRKFSTGKQTNKTSVMSWGMSQWKNIFFRIVTYTRAKQIEKGGASKVGFVILTCSHGHNVRSQEEAQLACRFVADLDVHVDLWVSSAFFRWRFSLLKNTKYKSESINDKAQNKKNLKQNSLSINSYYITTIILLLQLGLQND